MIYNSATSGKKLPELTHPATAAEILTGYEAINGDGELMTGTLENQTVKTGTIAFTGSSHYSFDISEVADFDNFILVQTGVQNASVSTAASEAFFHAGCICRLNGGTPFTFRTYYSDGYTYRQTDLAFSNGIVSSTSTYFFGTYTYVAW